MNYTKIENIPHLVSTEKTIIFDSGGDNIQQKSQDGSKFVVTLNSNLEIPTTAINIKADVHRVLIWNTFHNINSTNNKLVVVVLGVRTTITLSEGLYTPSTLNTELQQRMLELGFLPQVLTLATNIPQGKIVLQFQNPSIQVDFSDPLSQGLSYILGFNQTLLGSYSTASPNSPYNKIGDKIAHFNSHEYLLLKSNLTSGEGIMKNDSYQNIICQVPISVPPYSQIQDVLSQPVELDCNLLKGSFGSRNIWMELCDNKGEPIDTSGENYSVLIKIKYQYQQY